MVMAKYSGIFTKLWLFFCFVLFFFIHLTITIFKKDFRANINMYWVPVWVSTPQTFSPRSFSRITIVLQGGSCNPEPRPSYKVSKWQNSNVGLRLQSPCSLGKNLKDKKLPIIHKQNNQPPVDQMSYAHFMGKQRVDFISDFLTSVKRVIRKQLH